MMTRSAVREMWNRHWAVKEWLWKEAMREKPLSADELVHSADELVAFMERNWADTTIIRHDAERLGLEKRREATRKYQRIKDE